MQYPKTRVAAGTLFVILLFTSPTLAGPSDSGRWSLSLTAAWEWTATLLNLSPPKYPDIDPVPDPPAAQPTESPSEDRLIDGDADQ